MKFWARNRGGAAVILDKGLNAKEDFGAVGNGVVDDTAALNVAFAAAAARKEPVYIPAGIYNVTNLTIPTGTEIIGTSELTTVLQCTTASGDIITVSGNFVRISNLQITASVLRASGWAINIAANTANIVLSNLLLFHNNNVVNWILINNGTASIHLHEVQCVVAQNGLGLQIGNGTSGGGGLDLRILDCTFSSNTGARATANVCLQHVGDLTITHTQLLGASSNLLINPGTSQSVQFVKATQVWCDTGTVNLQISPTGTGFVNDISFNNCWFATGASLNVNIGASGSTSVSEIHIADSSITASPFGISLDGSVVQRISISGGYISGSSTMGLRINNVDGVIVDGVRIIGNVLGVSLLGACTNIRLDPSCDFNGNTTNINDASSGRIIGIFRPYTPTLGSILGALGGGNSAAGIYLDNGNGNVDIEIKATIGAAGAGTAAFLTATLPIQAAAFQFILSGKNAAVGYQVLGDIAASATTVIIHKYDATGVVANNDIYVVSGLYRIPGP